MTVQKIDGNQFYSLFTSGVGSVISKKDDLNSINVFPVMDGDTGTNLTLTLTSVVDETARSNDFSIVINSMSDVAITSARGNSGIIFASFINGLSKACGHLKELSIEDFSIGVVKASEEAYHSVAKPVEGTMLTVIRVWAEFINREYKRYTTFKELLEKAYERAVSALEETPVYLDILRKYRVVDSGAKGFVFFLEGINSATTSHLEKDIVKPTQPELILNACDQFNQPYEWHGDILNSPATSDLTERYCCEFTLKGTFQKKGILEDLGSALVITGNDRMTKVHIHTNAPSKVAALFVKHDYQITKSKVDDMALQRAVKNHANSKIGVLTDSICDLPSELLERYQIHMMSINVNVANQTYLDKQTLDGDQLSTFLEGKSYPKSSSVNSSQIRLKLDWMLTYYEKVIIISVSSQLSGMYESYKKAIDELGTSGRRVTLIDSKLNTGSQGLLVLEAARLAQLGVSHESIISKLNLIIERSRLYVSLKTFKYAVRSGRVPNTIGKLGMLFNIKPIMSLNELGEGIAFGIAFFPSGVKRKIVKLVRWIIRNEGIEAYAIVHASNEKEARLYGTLFEALIGFPPKFITDISAVTMLHAGKGAVAIALIKSSKANI